VLAVAAVSRLYEEIRAPADLPEHFIDNLINFWVQKDRLEGKAFRPLGVRDPVVAIDIVHSASRAAKKAA
jgi:inorganic pyrophosphatase